MTAFKLVEPCCGAASLTLHLLGAKNQILPYQGSKWKLRKQLEGILAKRGYTDLVSAHLADPGPWGHTWALLHSAPNWVVDVLRGYASEDPRAVYDRLHGGMAPSVGDPAFAAQHLFLQRLSHSGKAVGCKEMRWVSPGFNKTSAYGVLGTDKFGPVNPMIPALIRQIEQGWRRPEHFRVDCQSASDTVDHYVLLSGTVGMTPKHPIVVYLDPPYMNATRYPNGHLTRNELIRLARRLVHLGFFVVISEAEPIDVLVGEGWQKQCLKGAADHDAPFRAKNPEWVTISPAKPTTLPRQRGRP